MEDVKRKMEDVNPNQENYSLRKVFIGSFWIFLFSVIGFAQSVDSLINEAMLNNPYLKSLEQKIYSGE